MRINIYLRHTQGRAARAVDGHQWLLGVETGGLPSLRHEVVRVVGELAAIGIAITEARAYWRNTGHGAVRMARWQLIFVIGSEPLDACDP